MNTQLIPPFEPLVASLPSGRDMHSIKPFVAPLLDEAVLTRMQAPPDEDELRAGERAGDDSSDDGRGDGSTPVGAFPGTSNAYGTGEGYF